MLKGLRLWWYLIALVMIVLGLFLPMESVIEFILPLTWVWPVLIWSAMGTNETYYRTHQLIFTAVHPVRNQFIVLWLAGVIVAYLTGSGVMIHFLVTGEWERLTAMAVGGLFIPTLAVALGIWSGSGKLFQMVFMLMWYLGPLNKWVFWISWGQHSNLLTGACPCITSSDSYSVDACCHWKSASGEGLSLS